MSEQPDSGRLIAAFSALGVPIRGDEEESLRQAVCDYVAAAKAAGMLPEQVIVAIRGAERASQHEVAPSVMQRLIVLCLDLYFDRRGLHSA